MFDEPASALYLLCSSRNVCWSARTQSAANNTKLTTTKLAMIFCSVVFVVDMRLDSVFGEIGILYLYSVSSQPLMYTAHLICQIVL